VDLYTLYPVTVEVLAVQVSVTECEATCTPVPESVTVAGELPALLATVTLPGRDPAVAGVNVTFIVAACPGVRINPVCTPLTVYPAPERVTLEIVTLELPLFVNVTGRLLLLPILTLEKFRLAVLALRMAVEADTVSVAALLVTLPAPFETVTVNCVPLSADVVAGVVYEADVAPLMAAPPFFHWYVSVAVPVAVTENVAVCPVNTLLLAGCAVIEGAAFTVNVAPLLVTFPEVPVTVTVKTAPLSDAVVAGVVYEEDVAPLIAAPLFFH